jgi:phage terminase small subunit
MPHQHHKPSKPRELSDRQRRFVEEYLIDLNAVQAAIRAGYAKNSARVNAFMILRRPGVMEAVQDAIDARSKRTRIEQDRVLTELAAIAFCDPADIAAVPLNSPADIERLLEHARACIAGWGWNARGDFMVKLHNKLPALGMLAKHLGMYLQYQNTGRPRIDGNGNIVYNAEPLNTQPLNTEPLAATARWLEDILNNEKSGQKRISHGTGE